MMGPSTILSLLGMLDASTRDKIENLIVFAVPQLLTPDDRAAFYARPSDSKSELAARLLSFLVVNDDASNQLEALVACPNCGFIHFIGSENG